jgi:hypothetical protein
MTSIRVLPRHLAPGDVLLAGAERLTVRYVWCHRSVTIRGGSDHHYIVWATNTRQQMRQIALSSMGAYPVLAGPSFERGLPTLSQAVAAVITRRNSSIVRKAG